MLILADLQRWMAHALRHRDGEAAARIKPSAALTPDASLQIYQTQVWLRLSNLLQKEYPSLLRLFGPKDFNTLIAKPYLEAHFPTHPSLSLLGADLPAHLTTHYHAPDRRLIVPLTHIDAAYHRLKIVQPLPPLRIFDGPIGLQPTLALFALEADLFAFRNELLRHPPEAWFERDFPSIIWNAPRHILLAYQHDSFHIEELSPAAFQLLSAFQHPTLLADALALLSPEAAPHLFSWFQRWSAQGWLV